LQSELSRSDIGSALRARERPSVAGPDDEKMLGLYNALIHMGEAGGPDNRAVCEQIHRPKDTDT